MQGLDGWVRRADGVQVVEIERDVIVMVRDKLHLLDEASGAIFLSLTDAPQPVADLVAAWINALGWQDGADAEPVLGRLRELVRLGAAAAWT